MVRQLTLGSAVLLCLVLSGCDKVRFAPVLIAADGESYVACRDAVWITPEGGGLLSGGETTYKISFTDPDNLGHTIFGIRKLSVTDPPRFTTAPMPTTEPTTFDRDNEGNPYVEGRVYHWADGVQAVYSNGRWKPVMLPFTPCK
jgi:hypothetical protein